MIKATFRFVGQDEAAAKYDGQAVEVIRPLDASNPADHYDAEVGPMFRVRASNGHEFNAFGGELKEGAQ